MAAFFRRKEVKTKPARKHENETDEALETIREGLEHQMRIRKDSKSQKDVRFKCDLNGQKKIFHLSRPVRINDLNASLDKTYQQQSFEVQFVLPSGETGGLVHAQKTLDQAISIIDKSHKSRSVQLRLIAKDNNANRLPTASKRDLAPPRRDSPPPGSIHSSSHPADEGQFIPEYPHPPDEELSVASMYSGSSDSGNGTMAHSSYGTVRSRSAFSDTVFEQHRRLRIVDRPRRTIKSYDDDAPRPSGLPRWQGPIHMVLPEKSKSSSAIGARHSTPSSSGFGTDSSRTGSPQSMKRDSSHSFSNLVTSRTPVHSSSYTAPVHSFSDLAMSRSPVTPKNWKRGKLLGSGAYGSVYLAMDGDTGREMAVKQISIPENPEASDEMRALESEITILKNIHHERIVQYYGVDLEGRTLNIFMEYMTGRSVKDQIRDYGPVTEVLAGKYTRQMLEGLSFLHENYIVHRDIKCANVLRSHEGRVKLADFGSAQRIHKLNTLSATNIKTTVGSANWMSPEVIRGDGYGRKADIWSTGCTVIEMLSGSPPWKDYESMAVLYKVVTETPRYELPPRTSEIVVDFIHWTLERNVDRRPTSEQLLKHKFANDVSS